jgi:hypothetical protein
MATIPLESKHLIASILEKAANKEYDKRMAEVFNCAFTPDERTATMSTEDHPIYHTMPQKVKDTKEYEGTGKELRPSDIICRKGGDSDYIYGKEPTAREINAFNKAIHNKFDYGLWDVIAFDEQFIDYVKKPPCFVAWLLRLGYMQVKPKPIDKWDFDQGKWERIDWGDLDKLKEGTLIARVWKIGSMDRTEVRKIIGSIYNKSFLSNSRTLLAVKYRKKNSIPNFKHETYLSDLFRGKVYIRIGD